MPAAGLSRGGYPQLTPGAYGAASMRAHTNLWSATPAAATPPPRRAAPPAAPAAGPAATAAEPVSRWLVAIGSAIAAVVCALLIGLSLGGSDLRARREPPVLSGRGGNDVGRVYAAAGPGVVSVQVRGGGRPRARAS